jgi:hypothetical protein
MRARNFEGFVGSNNTRLENPSGQLVYLRLGSNEIGEEKTII